MAAQKGEGEGGYVTLQPPLLPSVTVQSPPAHHQTFPCPPLKSPLGEGFQWGGGAKVHAVPFRNHMPQGTACPHLVALLSGPWARWSMASSVSYGTMRDLESPPGPRGPGAHRISAVLVLVGCVLAVSARAHLVPRAPAIALLSAPQAGATARPPADSLGRARPRTAGLQRPISRPPPLPDLHMWPAEAALVSRPARAAGDLQGPGPRHIGGLVLALVGAVGAWLCLALGRRWWSRRGAPAVALLAVSGAPEAEPDGAVKETWEWDVAQRIAERCAAAAPGRPFVVGLAGIPGSGKTTSAEILKRHITALRGGRPCAVVVPMDGYHIPLAQLDSADKVYRRGAADTFDAARLKRDLRRLTAPAPGVVQFPGFDHAVGDPAEGAYTFCRAQHDVVIVEGLYLLREDWGLGDLFDMTVFIEADVDACVERLKVRNLCIPGYTRDEILERCERVDRVNAMGIVGDKPKADLCVASAAGAE